LVSLYKQNQQAMSIIELLLKEMEQEAQNTRKMLSIVPEDKYDWQPHPKSMTIERLVNHIAELFDWVAMGLTTDGLDFAANPYEPTFAKTNAGVLEIFEKAYANGHAQLQIATEAKLQEPWVLRSGDYVILNQTKYDTVRVAIAQTIHHRAQLGVFLRLLDVAIPGVYGPSADELEAQAQMA
jgi:uncharacterized damage-inducible protein DinB